MDQQNPYQQPQQQLPPEPGQPQIPIPAPMQYASQVTPLTDYTGGFQPDQPQQTPQSQYSQQDDQLQAQPIQQIPEPIVQNPAEAALSQFIEDEQSSFVPPSQPLTQKDTYLEGNDEPQQPGDSEDNLQETYSEPIQQYVPEDTSPTEESDVDYAATQHQSQESVVRDAPQHQTLSEQTQDSANFDPSTAIQKKILLVEDDNSLADVYQTRLDAENFIVKRVPNGEDALAAALDFRPDLIVLDAMMPKVSGFDVLDILRNTPDTANMRIIMLTALSQDSDKQRAKDLGVDDYLVKSQVVIADVVERIKFHLGL